MASVEADHKIHYARGEQDDQALDFPVALGEWPRFFCEIHSSLGPVTP